MRRPAADRNRHAEIPPWSSLQPMHRLLIALVRRRMAVTIDELKADVDSGRPFGSPSQFPIAWSKAIELRYIEERRVVAQHTESLVTLLELTPIGRHAGESILHDRQRRTAAHREILERQAAMATMLNRGRGEPRAPGARAPSKPSRSSPSSSR